MFRDFSQPNSQYEIYFKKKGTAINNKRKYEYFAELYINPINDVYSPFAYLFTICGRTANKKLFENTFIPELNWLAIPIAALTATPKKILRRKFIPCDAANADELPYKSQPEKESIDFALDVLYEK